MADEDRTQLDGLVDQERLGTFTFGGITVTRRKPTPEEHAEWVERRRKEAEFQATLDMLTPRQRQVYDLLDEMIDALYNAGVDVSCFPSEAQLVLVETAKKIS